MHESFLVYEGYRYLKLAAGLIIASFLIYLWHDPNGPPNGGTWLGYTLGIIGAGIIFLLLWFGVRKRQFHSTSGKVQGWLSAHVYLGASLIPIVTLHCGFQFGWNIHTLAYALMVIVVISGFYGVYTYIHYPGMIGPNLADIRRDEMLDEIHSLNKEMLKLAAGIGEKVHEFIIRDVDGTKFGGTVWQQLTGNAMGKDPLQVTEQMLAEILSAEDDAKEIETTQQMLAEALSVANDAKEFETMRQLLVLVNRKNNLVERVNKDIQYNALMEFWLYFHVPLSICLLAALITHIIVVFFYW